MAQHEQQDSDDEARFREYSVQLVDAIDAVIVDWVHRCVEGSCVRAGRPYDQAVEAATTAAAAACRGDVGAQLQHLISLDVDDQRVTPLQVLRSAVSYPGTVLADADVAPVDRDRFEREAFPEDLYGLTPAGFGDVDPSLAEPGLVWGAAKAHVHLRRHRSG
ncbi:MAG TPA: hypothetical protein PLS63_02135 [Microthrixaceae bacterium]|nr:hypothetical protein [Microthrixaceae bacterium]